LNVNIQGRIIETTAEHPFYEYAKGWIEAAKLEANDRVRTDNGWQQVDEVYDTGIYETVYNLRVAEFHTYFVGDEDWGFSVWAHNQCWGTARKEYWQNVAEQELAKPANLRMFSQKNIDRMAVGRAPSMTVEVTSRADRTITEIRDVSMELHHTYLAQRGGAGMANDAWNLTAVSPWAHEAMDSFRHVGWDLNRIVRTVRQF